VQIATTSRSEPVGRRAVCRRRFGRTPGLAAGWDVGERTSRRRRRDPGNAHLGARDELRAMAQLSARRV